MSATVPRPDQSAATDAPQLRSGISVSIEHGRLHAAVELHGELCAVTAPDLGAELRQLVDDGISDVTVDVGHLQLCTSHGLDVFDEIHRELAERHGGMLRVHVGSAPRTVSRVIHLVSDQDPTFSPPIAGARAVPAEPAPHERPGGSRS